MDTHYPFCEVDTSVAAVIRRRREALGLTQAELAERAGMTVESTITLIEAGRFKVAFEWAAAIATALQLDRRAFCEAVLRERLPEFASILLDVKNEAAAVP